MLEQHYGVTLHPLKTVRARALLPVWPFSLVLRVPGGGGSGSGPCSCGMAVACVSPYLQQVAAAEPCVQSCLHHARGEQQSWTLPMKGGLPPNGQVFVKASWHVGEPFTSHYTKWLMGHALGQVCCQPCTFSSPRLLSGPTRSFAACSIMQPGQVDCGAVAPLSSTRPAADGNPA